MIARRLTLVLLVALVGCTSASSTVTPSTPPASTASPPIHITPERCPKHTPLRLPHHGVPGVAHTIVPGSPVALVLCGGGSRAVAQGPRMLRLIASLNALRHVQPGTLYACPGDLGPTYTLFFDYVQGPTLTVTVGSSGCAFTWNGKLSAWTDEAVRAQIRALLRGHG